MSYRLTDGRKVVASAGTAEILADVGLTEEVMIVAETDNTGVICVGASTVVAALSTRRGAPLNAGDSIVLKASKVSDVYIDSTVNGDGVTFLATSLF